MKYRAEMMVWAYTDEGESLGCVYESPSEAILPRRKIHAFLNDAAWTDVEKTAAALAAVEKAPRLFWGINDFRNAPVSGTRAANEKNALFYFLQKKKIKWWWFQKLFGYYIVGPVPPQHVNCRCTVKK